MSFDYKIVYNGFDDKYSVIRIEDEKETFIKEFQTNQEATDYIAERNQDLKEDPGVDVFEIVKNLRKKNAVDNISKYNDYIINMALSFDVENVDLALLMDQLGKYIPKEKQYEFYLHTCEQPRSFTKWIKADKDYLSKIKEIQDKYEISMRVACMYLKL